MDTHIKGPRGASALGAIDSTIIVGAKLGDAASAAVEIFRTDGASSGLGDIHPFSSPVIGQMTAKKFPLFLHIHGYLIAAFNGTSPVFKIVETNLDDTGAVDYIVLGDFSANAAAGTVAKYKVLTSDKKYKLTYTPATGGPTTGEGYFALKITGPGQIKR